MKAKPRKFTDEQIARIMELQSLGWTVRQIAKWYGLRKKIIDDRLHYARKRGMRHD